MSRLECGKCKSIFKDVVKVRKCPGCGCQSFSDAEARLGVITVFPKWFTYQSNMGYFYHHPMRTDTKEGIIKTRD